MRLIEDCFAGKDDTHRFIGLVAKSKYERKLVEEIKRMAEDGVAVAFIFLDPPSKDFVVEDDRGGMCHSSDPDTLVIGIGRHAVLR